MLSMSSPFYRKVGLSHTAAHQLNLKGIRKICIFMYKIISVERGGLSHIALHKLFVFV